VGPVLAEEEPEGGGGDGGREEGRPLAEHPVERVRERRTDERESECGEQYGRTRLHEMRTLPGET